MTLTRKTNLSTTHMLAWVAAFAILASTLLVGAHAAKASPTSKVISLNGGFAQSFQIAVDSDGNTLATRALSRKFQAEYFSPTGRRVAKHRRSFTSTEMAGVTKYFVGRLYAGALGNGRFVRAVMSRTRNSMTLETTTATGSVIASSNLASADWGGFNITSREGLGGAVVFHSAGMLSLIPISADGQIGTSFPVISAQFGTTLLDEPQVLVLPGGGYVVTYKTNDKRMMLARVSSAGIAGPSVEIADPSIDAFGEDIRLTANAAGRVAVLVRKGNGSILRLVEPDNSIAGGAYIASPTPWAISVLVGIDGVPTGLSVNPKRIERLVFDHSGATVQRKFIRKNRAPNFWSASATNDSQAIAGWTEVAKRPGRATNVYSINLSSDGRVTKPRKLASNPSGKKPSAKWVSSAAIGQNGLSVVAWLNGSPFLMNGQFRFASR